MAKDSNGRLWVVYRDKDNGTYDVKVAYSDDGGATWTIEVVDAGRSASGQCALAVDSSNGIHVVWCDRLGMQVWLWYRTRTDVGVWAGIVQLYTSVLFSASLEPDIAIDQNDDVHVAFIELVGARFIKYIKKTGAVWGAVENAATNGVDTHIQTPSIAIDSTNFPHIAFCKDTPLNIYNIFYVWRTAFGWQPEESVSVEVLPGTHEYPQLALDSADDVHVVWMAYNRYNSTYPAKSNIYYRKRTTGVWGAEEQVTDVDFNQGWGVSISVSADGIIHVVWSGQGWGANPGEWSIQHRESSVAGVWSAQDDLVNEAGYNYLATSLCARYPSSNILSVGYMFIFVSEDTISDLEFYAEVPAPSGGGIPGVVELLT